MMHMSIYWGKNVTLLFDSWKTESWTSYASTLLACFLFSVFYQHIEDRRLRFKANASRSPSVDTTTPPFKRQIRWGKPAKLSGAVLFGLNSAVGYLLMLTIMSFNGGVFVAVVSGLAVGYYLFRSGDEDVVIVNKTCACS